jgi:hypothetical protein
VIDAAVAVKFAPLPPKLVIVKVWAAGRGPFWGHAARTTPANGGAGIPSTGGAGSNPAIVERNRVVDRRALQNRGRTAARSSTI